MGSGDGGDAADGLEGRTAAAATAAAEVWGQEEHSTAAGSVSDIKSHTGASIIQR